MRRHHYQFITRWQVRAPLDKVWDAIYQSEQWPQWWKGVLSVVETVKGDENGIGSVRHYTLSSPSGYRLRFSLLLTDRIDHQLLKGKASGELEGTGSWYFKEENGISYVECRWDVATTIGWMNRLAFLLAPLFRYNHKSVMNWGAKCLAKKLEAPLLSS